MKKLLILMPFMIAFVLMMSAGASSTLFAQSTSEESPATPAEQKAPAAEGKQDPKEKGFMACVIPIYECVRMILMDTNSAHLYYSYH